MIRFVVIGVILLLVLLLLKTFANGSSKQRPIDVDPVDASSSRGKRPADDDIIDVEPVEE